MGGSSAEREISIRSGSEVLRALHSLGYDAQSLDYDERFIDALRQLKPDVVFIALHGPGGEDGHVQALLEYLSIPYTGSGLEAAALSMDKHLTKKLLAAEGLPTPVWDLFDLTGGTLPLLPGIARSSARDQAALRRIVGRRHDRAHARGVDERDARGVEVVRADSRRRVRRRAASSRARCSAKRRCRSSRSSPTATASTATTRSTNPAAARTSCRRRSTKVSPRACRCSACRHIGCWACATTRAAISSSRATTVRICLEVNSLPGLTPVSLVPDACAAVGIGFEALIDRLVGYALARAELRDAVA